MVLYSAPTFWVCLIFIMIFATWLHWSHRAHARPGRRLLRARFSQSTALLHHLFLPAFTFAITYIGHTPHRAQRADRVAKEDYVLTARAKELSDSNVLWKTSRQRYAAHRHAAS